MFPCCPGGKRPAVDRWEERACGDADRVARYWPSSRHNVGVACGPSGLVVIDLDVSPDDAAGISETLAPYGAQQLAGILREMGRTWPDTLTVRTPSGGWHLYFGAIRGREIRNSASRIAPKVDVRGCGGYVIGPGSVVDSGQYAVTEGQEPALLPEWLAGLAESSPQPSAVSPLPRHGSAPVRLRGLIATVLDATPGVDRNSRLHWAACRAGEMVAASQVDKSTAIAALLHAAETIGLGQREARGTIASGMRGATA